MPMWLKVRFEILKNPHGDDQKKKHRFGSHLCDTRSGKRLLSVCLSIVVTTRANWIEPGAPSSHGAFQIGKRRFNRT